MEMSTNRRKVTMTLTLDTEALEGLVATGGACGQLALLRDQRPMANVLLQMI